MQPPPPWEGAGRGGGAAAQCQAASPQGDIVKFDSVAKPNAAERSGASAIKKPLGVGFCGEKFGRKNMSRTTEKPSLSLVHPTTSSTSPAQKFGPAGQALWDGIMSEYGIADIGGLELLRQACAAQDRIASIRAAIDHDGEAFVSRSGAIRANPLLRDELANRAFVCRVLEKLGITVEPLRSSVGRPPKG